ncbi:MAG: hypothetical protein Q6M04_10525, partial [Thermostichus sp. BF3_bins_97]
MRRCRIAIPVCAVLMVASLASTAPVRIGERPAFEEHVDQADVDAGKVRLDELFRIGKKLFDA